MAYIPYHTLMGYFYKPRPNVVNIIMKRIYKLHRVIFLILSSITMLSLLCLSTG